LKFLFGIVLAQTAAFTLIYLAPNDLTATGLMRLAVPLLFIALAVGVLSVFAQMVTARLLALAATGSAMV